jgi:hypothetical protein
MEEAVQVLQSALEKEPTNALISDFLIDILDHHMPNVEARGPHAKAQEALQRVTLEYEGTPMIIDEAVQRLYQQCHGIIGPLGSTNHPTQIWRGKNVDMGCNRHLMLFDTFNIISEYCFGCYKVSIEPRTVVELIKLMLVFDNLKLPNDNTRKCMVEARPEISGTYKGLIYCRSLDEGKDILKIVQAMVGEKISDKIPVTVKRGCSEYPIAYPEYGLIEDNGPSPMTYREEWREQEDYADKKLIGHVYPQVFDTHNHSGLSLRDALVMRTWLAYAATIGDLNYIEVSGSPMPKLRIEKRTLFQPVEDE